MSTLLIYGATGYTGRMAAERAVALGLNVEIAGRNQQRLASLAAQLGVNYRVFDADRAEGFCPASRCCSTSQGHLCRPPSR